MAVFKCSDIYLSIKIISRFFIGASGKFLKWPLMCNLKHLKHIDVPFDCLKLTQGPKIIGRASKYRFGLFKYPLILLWIFHEYINITLLCQFIDFCCRFVHKTYQYKYIYCWGITELVDGSNQRAKTYKVFFCVQKVKLRRSKSLFHNIWPKREE